MGESGKFEAVYFFDKNGIAKEMLNQEFESFLDGLMGMPELAGKTVQSAYVRINESLKITAMVFFIIRFDRQGVAESTWNFPLKSLSEQGVDGPDMGAGPVRIYMQSINSKAAYKNHLWDPAERGGKNDLIHVRDAVRNNRLCLSVDDPSSEWMGNASMVMREPTSAPAPAPVAVKPKAFVAMEEEQDHIPLATSTLATSDNDEFSQAIKIIESQRIKITALENTLLSKNKGTIGSEAELKKLQETLAITQKNLNISLELEIQLEQEKKALEVQFAEAKKELKNAEKELEKSKLALEKLNQQAKEKINKLKLDSDASLKSEKEKIEKQLSSRIKNLETQIETVREDVAKEKDQELRMEKQKIENLNKELTTLRGDKFRLMKDGAEGFFKKMEKADISFMSFKPGAGHITIDINDIASFLENPNVLVAEKCGLSVEAYEIWLAHYQDAVCNAPMPGGIVCGNKITRTDVPSKFKVGTSDRCTSHKSR